MSRNILRGGRLHCRRLEFQQREISTRAACPFRGHVNCASPSTAAAQPMSLFHSDRHRRRPVFPGSAARYQSSRRPFAKVSVYLAAVAPVPYQSRRGARSAARDHGVGIQGKVLGQQTRRRLDTRMGGPRVGRQAARASSRSRAEPPYHEARPLVDADRGPQHFPSDRVGADVIGRPTCDRAGPRTRACGPYGEIALAYTVLKEPVIGRSNKP